MVSGSPRIESIQHLAAGEVGEGAGAIALRSGFQHLVFVLTQAKYYQAISSVTAHSSSRAQAVMKRRALCACGAPSTARTISWLISDLGLVLRPAIGISLEQRDHRRL